MQILWALHFSPSCLQEMNLLAFLKDRGYLLSQKVDCATQEDLFFV